MIFLRTRYGYKRSMRPHNSTNSHARPSDKSEPRYSKGTVSSAVCALRAGAPWATPTAPSRAPIIHRLLQLHARPPSAATAAPPPPAPRARASGGAQLAPGPV